MGGTQRREQYVHYGRVARQYRIGRAVPAEVLARWGAAVRPHLPDRPARVLDLGAGTGIFAAAWPGWTGPGQAGQAATTVLAVEPSPAMIAAGVPGVRYVRARAEQLPLADRSVDVVWISTALHHFADLPRAVAESARVLREGGRVLVRTFLPGRTAITWLGAFPGQAKALARFMDLDRLAAVFRPVGLVVTHAEEVAEEARSFGGCAEWVALMREADSMLTALTDAEVAAGIRNLRADPHRLARNELSLVVFAPAQAGSRIGSTGR